MDKHQAKRAGLKRRERRVRSKICGTAKRPRLSVHRTNANIYAQVIDDVDAKTICTASTLDPEFRALGLHKVNSVVEQPDNESIRGMIFKVKHLVTVEEN